MRSSRRLFARCIDSILARVWTRLQAALDVLRCIFDRLASTYTTSNPITSEARLGFTHHGDRGRRPWHHSIFRRPDHGTSDRGHRRPVDGVSAKPRDRLETRTAGLQATTGGDRRAHCADHRHAACRRTNWATVSVYQQRTASSVQQESVGGVRHGRRPCRERISSRRSAWRRTIN